MPKTKTTWPIGSRVRTEQSAQSKIYFTQRQGVAGERGAGGSAFVSGCSDLRGAAGPPSVWPGDDKDLSPPTGAAASTERAWRAWTRGRKVARVPQGQALHPRLPRAVPKAAATAASCLFAHLNQRVHPTPNDRGEGRSPSLPSAGRAMPELRPVSLRDGCVLHDFVLLPAGHPQAVSVPLEARAAQGRGAPAFSP